MASRQKTYTMADFRDALRRKLKPWSLARLVDRFLAWRQSWPRETLSAIDDMLRQMIGVIDAMTPAERERPELVDVARRRRIARGAGVRTGAVKQLIVTFTMIRDHRPGQR